MNKPTKEELDAYEIELKKWYEYCESIKPDKTLIKYSLDPEWYCKDMAAWHMKRSCDAPNRPGYYRANND